jgi:hypothetical protein
MSADILGVRAFLEKPFTLAKLISTVYALVA